LYDSGIISYFLIPCLLQMIVRLLIIDLPWVLVIIGSLYDWIYGIMMPFNWFFLLILCIWMSVLLGLLSIHFVH